MAEETVQVLPLDLLLKHLGRLDLIKLDIEGAEGVALAGAGETLESHRPIVVTAFSPDQLRRASGMSGRDYLGLLETRGYGFERLGSGATGRPHSAEEILREFGRLTVGHIDLVCRPIQ